MTQGRRIGYVLGGVIVIAVIVGVVLMNRQPEAPAATRSECDPAGWWASVKPLVVSYFEQAAKTAQASDADLPAEIEKLDALYFDYADGDFSYCIYEVKSNIRSGMRNGVSAFERTVEQDDVARDVRLRLANQYFWMAADELKREGIADYDVRLETAASIWGGEAGNAAEATAYYTSLPTSTPAPEATEAAATPG